jgi:chromosome segregation ATPase
VVQAKRHRFFKRDQIDALTPDAVEGMIVRGIARRSRALAVDGIVVTLDDVIARQREFRLTELRRQTDDRALREQLAIQDELLEVVDQENRALSGQIRELQGQLEEAEGRQAQLQDEVASLAYDKDQLRRTAGEAEGRVRQMQAQRSTLASLRSLPQSLPEIIERIERLWPDRIVFTDRAKASAKRAGVNQARSDLDEAWRCLWAMATDLHETLFSNADAKGDLAQRFRERSGFELAMTYDRGEANEERQESDETSKTPVHLCISSQRNHPYA